ncbi:hypothetical protein, partial [Kitasatospora aburaviensis]|uniref:hypothetical protein n=1 Tax=Kitasatospora aburaviensis TaxID=67265 RepID=UPI0031E6372A
MAGYREFFPIRAGALIGTPEDRGESPGRATHRPARSGREQQEQHEECALSNESLANLLKEERR